MDKKVKVKWLAALKSGKYRKAKKVLRRDKTSMCCLGVLCDIEPRKGVEWQRFNGNGAKWQARYRDVTSRTGLPEPLMHSLRIKPAQEMDLWQLNDESRGWDKVIKYIEDNL